MAKVHESSDMSKPTGEKVSVEIAEGVFITVTPDPQHTFLMQMSDAEMAFGVSHWNLKSVKSRKCVEGEHFIRMSGAIPKNGYLLSATISPFTFNGILELCKHIKTPEALQMRQWAEDLLMGDTALPQPEPEPVPLTKTILNGTLQTTVDARTLHAELEIQTEFAKWIERRILNYGFVENEDYEVFVKNGENPNSPQSDAKTEVFGVMEFIFGKKDKSDAVNKGGRPTKEYLLSLDMAKELSMVENNEAGRRMRRYFIEVERKAREVATVAAAAVKAKPKVVINEQWFQKEVMGFLTSDVRQYTKKEKQFFKTVLAYAAEQETKNTEGGQLSLGL
jgi:phage anti-repressor protein